MALRSTIYKAQVSIADIDHGHYEDLPLTLALHPSETEERLMIRLLAMSLHAHEVQSICNGNGQLAFGAGLSNPDEPDISLRDYTGRHRVWIEVGQPEDKPLMKACQQSDQVVVYCFHHAAEVWWKGLESKVSKLDALQVWRIPATASQTMAKLAARNMQIQALIQDHSVTLSSPTDSVQVELLRWK